MNHHLYQEDPPQEEETKKGVKLWAQFGLLTVLGAVGGDPKYRSTGEFGPTDQKWEFKHWKNKWRDPPSQSNRPSKYPRRGMMHVLIFYDFHFQLKKIRKGSNFPTRRST